MVRHAHNFKHAHTVYLHAHAVVDDVRSWDAGHGAVAALLYIGVNCMGFNGVSGCS